MPRIRLIHWNAEEARDRAASLRAAGHTVSAEPLTGPGSLREIAARPPDAFVIDLTRLPSHGRDVALGFRSYKATRRCPIVFAEGDPEKVARIKTLLPDATFTTWSRIRGALKKAIARPPAEPVVPASNLAGYSGTPLPKKLGIKPGSAVALVGAPPGFPRTLGALPPGATLRGAGAGPRNLTIWFTASRKNLDGNLARLASAIGDTPMWIAWPKQASGMKTDLTQQAVRDTGLAAGLVDYKVCAIDATWAGLLFRRRKMKGTGASRTQE
jgi:hypothetical protein